MAANSGQAGAVNIRLNPLPPPAAAAPPAQGNQAAVPAPAPPSSHSASQASNHNVKINPGPKDTLWHMWRWELAGVCLSIGSLAAIVAILIWIDQDVLASWKAPISLNTSIALLATISQTAMLLAVAEGISQLKWIYFQQRPHRLFELQCFDDASRGPWGALVFMWRIRWQAAVASGGAAITLLALAMQSFTQQAIALPKRSVLASNYTATMQTSAIFDTTRPITQADDTTVLPSTPYNRIYDVNINDALYSGIFAPELQAQYHCRSGNCTWQSETLGVCSRCSDQSNAINTQCHAPVNGSTPTPYGQAQVGSTQRCTYTTPSGLVGSAVACDAYFNVSTVLTTSLPDTLSTPGRPDPIKSLLRVAFFQFPVALKNSDPGSYPNYKSCELYPPKISECEFYWCSKTVSSVFQSGEFQEKIVSSKALHFGPELLYQVGGKPSDLTPRPPYTVSRLPVDNHAYTPLYTYVLPGFIADDVPQEWDGVTEIDVNVLAPYPKFTTKDMNAVAHSQNAHWINIADALDVMRNTQQVLNVDLDSHMSSRTNTFISQKLYSFLDGNVSQAMDGIATSLTRAIRQGQNSTMVEGKSYVEETFVDVRWPWLILPIALVLLAALFFVMSVLFSREKSKIVWKSSCLPALFHGLQGWRPDELEKRSLDAMEESAKGMYAVLENLQGGRMALIKREDI